ncbi:hypothetical protein C8Q79DRAFT_912372 [Trametes meyenii]|nr:hypothetical protein C8Q79DRAFT_912372 [Trametes meyenii]
MDNHTQHAHERLLAEENPPSPDDLCALCSTPLTLPTPTSREDRVRCRDCMGRAHFCVHCLHQYHRLSPFHRLLRWNIALRMWEKVTMAEMGLVLHGGHGGRQCPHKLRDTRKMTIVHGRGVLTMKVSFCECVRRTKSYDHDEALQLIDMGLYPASWDEPRTAFTQEVIRVSSLLTAQGGLSTQDFYRFLQRTTDNVSPERVTDRYQQLMVSQREFDYLLACKRNAVDPSRKLPARTLVVLCPACPQPGKNMRPNWETREESLRYLDALFYSVDGNFHQKQRKKPMDKNDIALSEGASYFVDSTDFARYMDGIGPEEQEETTCHKFAAMGYGGHTGQVTGTVALVCRHLTMLPSSMVDLKGAENQRAVDFSVVTGVQPYVGLRLFKLYYDIACQYMVHFLRRLCKWDKLLPVLRTVSTATLPEVQASVGKFHVYGHTLACRTFQSPNFVPFNGRTDGEGSEREWPFINEAAARTQEMTSGHRHDAINTLISDLNIRQVHKMPQTLAMKLAKAEKRLASTTKYLAKVEKGVTDAELVAWKAEELEWLNKVVDIANHKELWNPYNASGPKALSAEATLSEIRTEFGASGDATAVGMTGAVQGMLDLERRRREIAASIRTVDRSKKRQRAAITRKVDDFLLEAELAVDSYNRYVSILVTQASDAVKRQLSEAGAKVPSNGLPWRDSDDDKACGISVPKASMEKPLDDAHLDTLLRSVENVPLYLPSMYHSLIRQHPIVAPVVQIERRLREGQANDALDNLRTHLTARYSLRDLRRQGQGPKHGKAIRDLAKGEKKVGDEAKREYRCVRALLRALGMEEDDEHYRYLCDEDVKPLVVEEDQYVLNSNSKEESWLWRDFGFIKRQGDSTVQKFYMHRMKPHWFRSRANRARWEEEVRLLREEMFRTMQMFRNGEAEWEDRGRQEDATGRTAHAVYARKQAHRYHVLLQKCMKNFPLEKINKVRISVIRLTVL